MNKKEKLVCLLKKKESLFVAEKKKEKIVCFGLLLLICGCGKNDFVSIEKKSPDINREFHGEFV